MNFVKKAITKTLKSFFKLGIVKKFAKALEVAAYKINYFGVYKPTAK